MEDHFLFKKNNIKWELKFTMNSKFKSNNIVPIILAAGRGSRMGGLTKDKPKSFIKISKTKRLIDKVIENFESLSFKKITIITGYKSNHFNQFKKINKITL